MNIILFGPPGAGKGTQADNLVKDFKLHKVSTGDLLRKEILNETVLGKKIKPGIDKGLLVSDEIVNDLIEKILKDKAHFNQLIFDGYPRNLSQAKKFDELLKQNNQKISCVLSLEVEKDTIIKRVLGRKVCKKCGLTFNEYFETPNTENHHCDEKFIEKRSDDNKETIVSRYNDYLKKTLPIIDFYKDQDLVHEINGKSEISKIYVEIHSIIASLVS